MTSASLCLVTPRDKDLFAALDRCPLTVRQLLRLSATFAYPFTTERRVQERLQRLCAAGRVRRWLYATAGQGALSYYTLSSLGYRLLHGLDAPPAARGLVGPVGVARQAHTQALAEVVVRLFVSARAAAVPIARFSRENSLRLDLGDEVLYPDGAFELQPDPRTRFRYFLEIDNRSETVSLGTSLDSWGRKVQFYEKLQDAREERFRVLVVTTGGRQRIDHMLETAASLARNPRRSLVYGISLADLLDADNALTSLCFRNAQGRFVALLSAVPAEPQFRCPCCERSVTLCQFRKRLSVESSTLVR